MGSLRLSLQGQKYGAWEVLTYAGRRFWMCRCGCGVEKRVRSDWLLNGNSTCCVACSNSNRGSDLWNEENLARIKELYAAGYSNSEIGRMMGITKGQVSGKASRIGLQRDEKPKHVAAYDRAAAAAKCKATKKQKVAPSPQPPPDRKFGPEPLQPIFHFPVPSPDVTLIPYAYDNSADMCRFVDGPHPGPQRWMQCDALREAGCSYCLHHWALETRQRAA
jgi:hypothetical protein